MDSKEDAERGSSGDGTCSLIASEFSSDSSEGITPPPLTPAWAFVTDDDATPPPRDIDPEAVHPQASVAPEAADGASVEEGKIITSRISSGLANSGVPPTERAEVTSADLAGLLPARAALLLVTAAANAVDVTSHLAPIPPGENELGWSLPPAAAGILRPSDDPPPSTSSARPSPKDEDITTCPAICDERDDGREEEKREEGEDDEAPRPPEMVAAEFEEAKPELIDDDGCAPVPPGQIAASFEGRGYEEEKREEGEDDEAPRPPDMVAASFEAGKVYEEETLEEDEDEEAPRPPSMIAASCEEIDTADRKETKKPPVSVAYGVDPKVPEERTASAQEAEENIACTQDFVNILMQEIDDVFNSDGTPANTGNHESLVGPSSSSNQPPSTASNVQVGAPSISLTPRRGDEPSLDANGRGHVEISIRSTEESMSPPLPNFDLSQQLLPLLEATLVQDVPEEPVYDAFPMPAPEVIVINNDAHGWSRISLKWRVVVFVLILVAMAAIIAVVVMIAGSQNEPPSPMNDVSNKIAAFSLFLLSQGATSHLSIHNCLSVHRSKHDQHDHHTDHWYSHLDQHH